MVAKATTTVLCMTGINTVNGVFLNVKFSLNNKNLNIFQFCTKLVSLDEVCSETVSKAGKETAGPCPSRRTQRFCVTPCHNTQGMCTALPTVIKTLSSLHSLRAGRGKVTHCRVRLRYFCSQDFLPRGDNHADGDFAKRSTRFATVGATYFRDVIKMGDSQITPHQAAFLQLQSDRLFLNQFIAVSLW